MNKLISLAIVVLSLCFFACNESKSSKSAVDDSTDLNTENTLEQAIAKRDSFFSIKGVDVVGNVNDFHKKLIKAGFKRTNLSLSTYSGTKTKYVVEGTYADSPCKIAIFDKNNLVHRISIIMIDEKPNLEVFPVLLKKYSQPDETREILGDDIHIWNLYSGELSYTFTVDGFEFVTKIEFESNDEDAETWEEKVDKAKNDM